MLSTEVEDTFDEVNQFMKDNYYSDYSLTVGRSGSRSGHTYFLAEVYDDNHSDKCFSFVGIEENGTVTFSDSIRLRSMGNGFFCTPVDTDECNPEIITKYLSIMFTKLAQETKGTIAFIIDNEAIIVDSGKRIQKEIEISLSDGKKIYRKVGNNRKSDTVYASTIDDDYVYTPQIILEEWINEIENEALKDMISGLDNMQNRFETIGAYLISKKNSGEIDALHFIDLFKQTCDYADMYGGFKNPTLKTMSTLFVDSIAEIE